MYETSILWYSDCLVRIPWQTIHSLWKSWLASQLWNLISCSGFSTSCQPWIVNCTPSICSQSFFTLNHICPNFCCGSQLFSCCNLAVTHWHRYSDMTLYRDYERMMKYLKRYNSIVCLNYYIRKCLMREKRDATISSIELRKSADLENICTFGFWSHVFPRPDYVTKTWLCN